MVVSFAVGFGEFKLSGTLLIIRQNAGHFHRLIDSPQVPDIIEDGIT